MADEVKNGLSADPSRIASQWNRSTVADGSWLQKYTLSPLTARDYYLASAIDALGSATDDTTSALSAAISSVSSIHDEYIHYLSATISGDISGYIDYVSGQVDSLSSEFKTSANAISSKLDNEIQRASEVEEVLQNQINLINASTDVINVFGSYGGENGFSVESAYYFDPAKTATYHLTNNDIIKIINDEYTPVEETGQITTGHQTYYQWINNEGITGDPQRPSDGSWNFIGYTEPYYNIAEVNNKFTDISATVADNYLSAKGAVHQGKNIVVTEDLTKPEITISTSADVEFTNVSSTNISATNVTALTATGNSAKFTNISATNISADLFKSYLGTVDTCNLKFSSANGDSLTANKANIINLSATTLYSQSNNSNVDSLIGSAENGQFAYNVVNSAKFSAINSTTSTAFLSGGFGISAGNNLSLSFADNIIKLNAKDTGITAISAGNTQYTGPVFSASAGTGINFVNDSNNVLGIKASNSLITSATGGSAAYNWITSQSATLSAGSGINFNSAGPNTLGISVNYTTTNGYVTELDGVPLSAGANYTQGRCITIDSQNKINLSSDINLNEKLVIDHYNSSNSETYATANLESYKLDFSGSRDSGGSFVGQSATYNIYQLMIDYYADNENLSFVKLDKEKLQLSASTKIGGYTVKTYTNLADDYFETQNAGSNNPHYLKFDSDIVSAGTNSSTITAAKWYNIVNKANGTWVSGTSEQITIDAPSQTKIVVTASVPGSFSANTYYII